MKTYIACALTHLPRDVFADYAGFIHALSARLSDYGIEVKYALTASDPQLALKPPAERARLCYLWDKRMVEEADVLIAEVSFPSTGVGIELQIAAAQEKPIVLLAKDFGTNRVDTVRYSNPDQTEHSLQVGDGIISLMARGIPSIYRAITYSTQDDGIEQTVRAIQLLVRS